MEAVAAVQEHYINTPNRPDGYTLATYDFDSPNIRLRWARGQNDEGAINIHGHSTICALYAVSCSFTTSSYKRRKEARATHRFDYYGTELSPLPKMSSAELMMMDMDYLMSAIHADPNPTPVVIEMFTNDHEDHRWLAFVERCPYAYKVFQVPSKMDKYMVTCWLFAAKDPRV